MVETDIRSGKWLVMEEMVKGAAPEPDKGAYIAEKKGFFSWTRRNRGVSRSKSTSKGAFDRGDKLNQSITGSLNSKTSIGPDQQARIQAAAQQLSARQQQQKQAGLPERRGRTDADAAAERTQSVLTLQPVIVKEASPAMKWAHKYDKDTIREAYLGNINAGRGVSQFNGTSETYGSMTNGGSRGPEVPSKSASLPASRVQSPTPAQDEAPAVPHKNMEDIHPAERPGPVGRNSPLPPLPREEDDMEAARQTMTSPEPGSVSPDNKKHKKLHKEERKAGSGFRKLFGRHKNRQSKLPENAANDVNNFLAAQPAETVESSRAQSPMPETPRPQPIVSGSLHETQTKTPTVHTDDDKTPTQVSAPVEAHEPTYDPSAEDELSRVDTADANEARNEFSRFDQGPLTDQPAFAPPDVDSEDEAVPPPIARHGSRSPPVEGSEDAAPSPVIATQDRWAAIRRNAAERAATRQSEEQSRGGYSKTTDGDDETSGEESKSMHNMTFCVFSPKP